MVKLSETFFYDKKGEEIEILTFYRKCEKWPGDSNF